MKFSQFLSNNTDAICFVSSLAVPSVRLISKSDSGRVSLGSRICPFRLWHSTSTGFVILKTMDQKCLYLESCAYTLCFDILSFNGSVGHALIMVRSDSNQETFFLSIEAALGTLTLKSSFSNESLWLVQLITGIRAFLIDPITFLVNHFMLENYSSSGSPLFSPFTEIGFDSFFHLEPSRRLSLYNGFTIYAVSLGDGITKTTKPLSANRIPAAFVEYLPDADPWSKKTIGEFLKVKDDDLYVIGGCEAALYGSLRTVQFDNKWILPMFPIVSISASIFYRPGENISLVVMDSDKNVVNMSHKVHEWDFSHTVSDKLSVLSDSKACHCLSIRGYRELLENSSSVEQTAKFSPMKLFMARWHYFLEVLVGETFNPQTIVLSGSLVQHFWSSLSRNVVISHPQNSFQFHLLKDPLSENVTFDMDNILQKPIVLRGTDLGNNLGAAIGALRNMAFN